MTPLLERWLTALLVRLVRLLPPPRRDWPAAMIAEARSVPAGARRLRWLLGAVPVVVREVGRVRRLRQASTVAAVVVLTLLLLPFGTVTALVGLAVAVAVAVAVTAGRPAPRASPSSWRRPRSPRSRPWWATAIHRSSTAPAPRSSWHCW